MKSLVTRGPSLRPGQVFLPGFFTGLVVLAIILFGGGFRA